MPPQHTKGGGEEDGAYLDIRKVVPLHSRHAPPLIEPHLPHAAEIREQVPHALAVAHVPHFERAVTARDHLLPIVLEAGDGACVRRERGLADTGIWVPDTERAVRGSAD